MTKSVQMKMAHGALWMILFKFVERTIGLISTLILVRLLAPAEFGIVAMAMSFVAMAELLAAFGFDIALIQRQDATEEHYHTAWTLNILLGLAISVLMLVAASPVSNFYHQPEVFWIMCALAAGPLISGAENIGVVAFRKDLEFRKEFLFQVSRKAIGFLVVIPLAFWLQNYWALVAGILAARISGTTFSYLAHPFRPHFTLSKAANLVNFSKWLLMNNAVGFLKERSSDFFIGRVHGAAVLGLYNVSYEFANLPTTELSAPINRALLPGFAKLKSDTSALAASYLNAIRLLSLIAVPAAVGVFAVAPYFVPVVLGAKWLGATPLLELLAFNGVLLLFHSSICSVLIATGHPDRVTKTNAVYVVILVAALFMLTSRGATGAAYAVLAASILSTPIYLFQVRHCIGVGIRAFIFAIIRPVAGSIVMIAVVRSILPEYAPTLSTLESAALFAGGIAAGIATYISFMAILWTLLGRPEGAEQLVLAKATELIKSRIRPSRTE